MISGAPLRMGKAIYTPLYEVATANLVQDRQEGIQAAAGERCDQRRTSQNTPEAAYSLPPLPA